MSAWDTYRERMAVVGSTKRTALVNGARRSIARRMLESPSCHKVLMGGKEQSILITHKEDLALKRICAIPGEKLIHGGLVEFANHKWLITELDADNEIYERGLMQQCNHILRWIGKDGVLREKWCIVEDGTKYLIGEKSADLMAIGDARIAITIGKDADTVELSRGLRFLIDDSDSEAVLAYQITKPNKLFNVYNDVGIFRFILNEVNLTDSDNKELRIADYTSWKPPAELDGDHKDSDYTIGQIVSEAKAQASVVPDDNKEVWL